MINRWSNKIIVLHNTITSFVRKDNRDLNRVMNLALCDACFHREFFISSIWQIDLTKPSLSSSLVPSKWFIWDLGFYLTTIQWHLETLVETLSSNEGQLNVSCILSILFSKSEFQDIWQEESVFHDWIWQFKWLCYLWNQHSSTTYTLLPCSYYIRENHTLLPV